MVAVAAEDDAGALATGDVVAEDDGCALAAGVVVADDAPVVADADGAVDRLLAAVKGCVLGVVDAAGERVAAD